jgi:hypothetical protein
LAEDLCAPIERAAKPSTHIGEVLEVIAPPLGKRAVPFTFDRGVLWIDLIERF